MWDNVAEVMDASNVTISCSVKGILQVFHNNRPQLTIHKMQRMEDPKSIRRFLSLLHARSRGDVAELRESSARYSNPHLQRVAGAIFSDEEIARRFCRRPPPSRFITRSSAG